MARNSPKYPTPELKLEAARRRSREYMARKALKATPEEIEARRLRDREYYSKNKLSVLARKKEYREKNIEKFRQRDRDNYKKDPAKSMAGVRKAQIARGDEYLEYMRASNQRRKASGKNADYRAKNKARMNAHTVAYQAAKTNQTPSWFDFDLVEVQYKIAARISEITGIQHHVDHVYPLRGKLVSGLHVQGNLRVIAYDANIAKSNHFEVV